MKLDTKPLNTALMGGITEVGEFRIRNSAKAFSILSSGLYSNKIRAIIRELSCNAADSHVESGSKDLPFDIHLPNAMEPWFSIRDYGTGLTHDQVTNIYTTYFESTKTDSNEFVGALGLGSKSPFSYSDNFSVTAIRDGIKNNYSAFINDHGVPSVARMSTSETDEPSGVEIQMAVTDTNDFYKFADEATYVFHSFTLKPNVTGNNRYDERSVTYKQTDMVSGVHLVEHSPIRGVYIVMGSIPYPIDMPNPENNLGELANLLDRNNNIEINVDIGDVDFQPSREGLSYTPRTIVAIRKKLQLLNTSLAKIIKEEVDKIDEPWIKAAELVKKSQTNLFAAAAKEYAVRTNNKLVESRHDRLRTVSIKIQERFLTKLNIKMSGTRKDYGYGSMTKLKAQTDYSKNIANRVVWAVDVDPNTTFVVNDTNVGAIKRAQEHFRLESRRNVYLLEAIDKKKPMRTDILFQKLSQPNNIVKASSLRMLERKQSTTKAVTDDIMLVQPGDRYDYATGRWNTVPTIDDSKTYYYLPLSNYSGVCSKTGEADIDCKRFAHRLKYSGIPELQTIELYGVRKNSIKAIEKKKNWINVEKYIKHILNNLDESVGFAGIDVDHINLFHSIAPLLENKDSDVIKLINMTKDQKHSVGDIDDYWFDHYGISFDHIKKFKEDIQTKLQKVSEKYSLLDHMSYRPDRAAEEVVIYINAVDKLRPNVL